MKGSPTYERAVALFGALVERPSRVLCLNPVDMLSATGRATSTGYRALAEAEASGLLSRDLQQAYGPGPLARRIGFSAYGAGELANVAAPILLDLRETVRRTALVGFSRDGELHVGLYSVGRGSDFVRVAPVYDILGQEPSEAGHTMTLQEAVQDGKDAMSRIQFRAATGIMGEGLACHIGVIAQGDWPERGRAIVQALGEAGERLFSARGAI
ncbi:MAG TPA: hypothetical protein VIL84_13210 [Devosiaceae bacterium]